MHRPKRLHKNSRILPRHIKTGKKVGYAAQNPEIIKEPAGTSKPSDGNWYTAGIVPSKKQ